MRRPILTIVLAWLAISLQMGCLPRTFVCKNPGAGDQGVRYYRPKPYLALRPQLDKNGAPVEGYVRIDLEYLPDFSEEYSLHIRSGFGTNATSVTLDQGWNPTSLNVDLDSQTDENIEALGALLGEVAGAVAPRASNSAQPFVARASNVPLGYYEAVVGGAAGCKQLYGFRYVGFFPFASCPIVPCGTPESYNCACPSHELYALVYESGHSGVMTFKRIASVEPPCESR